MNRPSLQDFVEPSWRDPIDMQRTLAAVPDSATITGMFLEATAREAQKRGKIIPSARDKYIGFRFYPLREHVLLLIEGCTVYYPGKPARMALRKLGRAAPNALLTSTFGRVGMGSAQSPQDIIAAMAKSYGVSMPSSSAHMLEVGPKSVIVRLQSVPYFLDCHHVGVYEGVLRFAGVDGDVKVRSYGPADADLLCTWK